MDRRPVLVAGGGIGGLCVALTLHQIGVPCLVLESVRHLQPLGVGINLQPNAVRELYELGIGPEQLDAIGLQTRELVLVGLNGKEVYAEPRGLRAGYKWPQYSVHRGGLQMLLYRGRRRASRRRRRSNRHGGHRLPQRRDGRASAALVETRDGERLEIEGSLLIGADGLHSAVRAQMHPGQPPIQWGGAIMWRGVTPGVPIRTGASFVGLGTHRHRVVFYPIAKPDPVTGLAPINWIAEITVDNSGGWTTGDWNRQVERRVVHPSFRRLELRLAGRSGHAPRRRCHLRVSDDRSRSRAHLGGRQRRAAWRCGPRDVSDGLERCESGHDGRARAGCRDARARRDRTGAAGLRRAAVRARSRRWCCGIAGRDRSASSICWTSAAAACSTTSTR